MIIEANDSYTTFEDLGAGDVFRFKKVYYIKIDEDYENSSIELRLDDGEIVEFFPYDEVVEVKARLVIE